MAKPAPTFKTDVAFFSFDVNVPRGDTIELTLSIYDWGGDMILSQTYPDVVSGQRNDQLVKWNLENQAGTPVARGLYVFRWSCQCSWKSRKRCCGKCWSWNSCQESFADTSKRMDTLLGDP